MAEFIESLVNAAHEELARFKNGTGRETDFPYYQYVGEYWSYGLKNSHIDGKTTYMDSKGKPYRPAWSSAFISFVVRKAGATDSQFLFSEGHIHYVVDAIRDAAAGNSTVAYWGQDPRSYTPKVGDLINAGRGAGAGVTYSNVLSEYGSKLAPNGNFIPSHSDVVVKVEQAKGLLYTIGGNVSVDTVGMKTWKTDPTGILKDASKLIAVLECRI
jgi:hypothetical protein